jgi:hypothetical protein
VRNIQSLRFLGAILLPALLSAASPQTITFRPIANQIFGAPPVLAVAQASSGLPVSLISASPAVCKVDAELVTLVGAGLCTLTAGQNGNATWSAAVSVRQTFMVNPAKTSGALSPAPGSPFGIWANGQAVVTADFNMDGIPDIATANGKANNVTLLLGDGKGGFANAAGSPFAAGTGAFSLVAADLNGDGFPDLAVVDSSGLTVLLGNGQGGFPVTSTIPLAPGAGPSAVAVGDFNGDGFPDLAVADRINSAVIPLIGNGKGSFTPGATLTLGNSYLGPVSLVVADFNGDGFQDLAVASQVSGTIAILTGNGLGGFAPVSASLVKVGAQPFSLATGDFNGDGMPDLATADNAGNTVSVMLGNGSGAFSPAPGSPYAISSPWAIAVGDFNGDGFTDLILGTASGVTVLTGNGRGGFSVINGTPAAAIPISIATADFNGDGMLDLATANYESSTVTVLLGGMASTSLVLSTTATPTVPLGQAIPLAATVSDVGVPFSSPTGLVVFYDGATPLGAAAQTVGPYSFTASGLNGGTHILTAAYGGDANSSPSTSNAVTIQEGGPSPVLSSLNPSQWTPGGATFTLTVTGMNFVQTSQLQWNGLTLPAKFVSATQITVSIPVGVIAVAGPAALAVVNPGNSLTQPHHLASGRCVVHADRERNELRPELSGAMGRHGAGDEIRQPDATFGCGSHRDAPDGGCQRDDSGGQSGQRSVECGAVLGHTPHHHVAEPGKLDCRRRRLQPDGYRDWLHGLVPGSMERVGASNEIHKRDSALGRGAACLHRVDGDGQHNGARCGRLAHKCAAVFRSSAGHRVAQSRERGGGWPGHETLYHGRRLQLGRHRVLESDCDFHDFRQSHKPVCLGDGGDDRIAGSGDDLRHQPGRKRLEPGSF